MPQAVQIETQAEQQGLAYLHGQTAAWCAAREFAFDRREDTLDQSTAPVDPRRKRPPHFGTHPVHAPSFLSTLRGDHALCPEFLADVAMVPLTVELRIGQHQPDGSSLRRRFDDGGQIRAVVPRSASCRLRQQELLIQIGHDHPLQPMPPRQRLLAMVMQATDKKRADGSLRQTRGVHSHAGSSPAFAARAAQPTYRLADRPVDDLIVQSLQEAVQGREIGYAGEPQRLTQFAVFAEPYFGLAKGLRNASDRESPTTAVV